MTKFLAIFFLLSLFNIDTNYNKTVKTVTSTKNLYSIKKPKINRKPISNVNNHIFIVSHNKSPNVVVYQANIESGGYLNIKKPVDVFWLLNNKGKITEELNFLEWKLAFGFKVITLIKGQKYKMKLNAFKNKAITIVKNKHDKVKSYILIKGKTALLKKVFFHYEESFYLPQVKFIKFTGIDIKTGKLLTEKLIVNK